MMYRVFTDMGMHVSLIIFCSFCMDFQFYFLNFLLSVLIVVVSVAILRFSSTVAFISCKKVSSL